MNPVLPLQKKSQGLKLIKEIPKATYKKLFEGSYNRSKKYKPKKSRAKTLKTYKQVGVLNQ